MRRRDREVTEMSEIMDILSRCDTIRIGIQGEAYPYVVPVSFGWEAVDGQLVLYFHCARQGLKLELLREHPQVCVEADRFLRVEETAQGITTRYESVIGFGSCTFPEEPEEIRRGLRRLTEHYGFGAYPLDRCEGMENLRLGRITIASITGKRNLPEKL